MKKTWITLGTVLAAGAMTTAMALSVFAAQITEEQAKSIALGHAGVKAEDVAFMNSKSDFENGRMVYDIEFLTSDYKEYDYEIAKDTGEILSWDYDAEHHFLVQNQQVTPGGSVQAPAAAAPITEEQAKSIALEHAGIKAEDVAFMNSKSDFEDGRPVYDIEFLTSDYREYDYEIDKNTGTIISWDYDAEYQFSSVNSPQANSKAGSSQAGTTATSVSLEDAKAAALKFAGLRSQDVTWKKVKQDYDDGRFIYEGEFYCGTLEYEFEVDAASGVIIDWDVESIYD